MSRSSGGRRQKESKLFLIYVKRRSWFSSRQVPGAQSLRPAHRLAFYSRQKGISFIPHLKTRATCTYRHLQQAQTVKAFSGRGTLQRCAGLAVQKQHFLLKCKYCHLSFSSGTKKNKSWLESAALTPTVQTLLLQVVLHPRQSRFQASGVVGGGSVRAAVADSIGGIFL